MIPTIRQRTEQKIQDNRQYRIKFLERAIFNYAYDFLATPTPDQLSWFIFERSGVRMELNETEFNTALENTSEAVSSVKARPLLVYGKPNGNQLN